MIPCLSYITKIYRIYHHARMTVKRSLPCACLVRALCVPCRACGVLELWLAFFFSRAMWLVWQYHILVMTVTSPCPCRVSGIWLDECVPCPRPSLDILLADALSWPRLCRGLFTVIRKMLYVSYFPRFSRSWRTWTMATYMRTAKELNLSQWHNLWHNEIRICCVIIL